MLTDYTFVVVVAAAARAMGCQKLKLEPLMMPSKMKDCSLKKYCSNLELFVVDVAMLIVVVVGTRESIVTQDGSSW